MCIRNFIGIKSVAVRGIKYGFVPCGKCYDCMTLQRNEWSTRLRLHIDSIPDKDNYWAAFCTLTFSPDAIPRVPRVLYRNPKMYTDNNLCFRKDIGQRFCRSFRDHLRKVYGVVKPVYLFCSEFGEITARPHHHFFCFLSKSVDAKEIFNYINRKWKKYGFVFPRNFNGGTDRNGYAHKPFLVDNLYKTVSYVCKYVTKSIAFEEHFNTKEFWHESKDKTVRLADFKPYHIQTRSLAKNWLDSTADSKKMNAMKSGFFFVGYDKLVPCPLYIRRKLLFDNDYVKEKGRRLVRRHPSNFFIRNVEEIFNQRLENRRLYYEKIMPFIRSQLDSGIFGENIKSSFYYLSRWDARTLARWDLLYFGRDWGQVRVNSTALEWLAGYDWRKPVLDPASGIFIDYEFYQAVQNHYYNVNMAFVELTKNATRAKAALERDVNKIRELRYIGASKDGL